MPVNQELSRMSLGRPRPTHAIPKSVLNKIEFGFPEKNIFDCSNGVIGKWRRSRWINIESDIHDVQCRQVLCALYENDVLIGALQATETRNAHHVKNSLSNYMFWCDAVSEEYLHHAEAVSAGLKRFFRGRHHIKPRESFLEICTLFILPAMKGRLIWVDAINQFVKKLYESDKDCSLLILKTLPLEYVNFKPTEPGRAYPLRDRRIDALCKLYEDKLGVVKISDRHWTETWMGKKIAHKKGKQNG